MPVIEQLIPSGTWQADKVHSSIGFNVKHMVVATFRSTFEDYDAGLTVDETGATKLVGVVRAASIVVKDENLGGHLSSPEFFDVEQHPELRFESTAFREDGDEVVVDGHLTIKGVTHAVEAHGTLTPPHENIQGGLGVGLSLTTVVDRTAYGLNWNAPLPKGGVAVSNDVTLVVDLELTQV